jgi:Acetyltransferase (GNAT) domain
MSQESSSKVEYRRFCQSAPADLPLFCYDWYLDATCIGGAWDAAVVEMAGKTVAVWPYFRKQKLHWSYVAMPQLTKFMGPYLLPEYRHPADQQRLIEKLWSQIPTGLAAFEQDFHYPITNWLPLYWQGFRQTTRYSYTLDLTLPEADLWQHLDADYRNRVIKRAQTTCEVRSDLSLAELYRVNQLSYTRQGLAEPFSFSFFERLDAALAAYGARKCFFATDRESNVVHAVVYLIWDRHSAYLAISGSDPALRQSGASILLIWEAIRFAKNELQLPVFDFEGSMLQGVEPVFRRFGSEQRPYFRLLREWNLLWKLGKWRR